MDKHGVFSDRTVVLQYSKQKINQASMKFKTLLFLLIIVMMTFLDSVSLKNSIQFTNSWDLIFDIVDNKYIQLYFFLFFFLFYVFDVCHDKQITHYIMLRLRQKTKWLYAKIGSLLVLGTVYTLLYTGLVCLLALLFQGYDSSWSQGVSGLQHGIYTPFVTPVQGLGMIFVRYLLSVWLVSILYLLIYTLSKKHRNTKARSSPDFCVNSFWVGVSLSMALPRLN
ncbi:hypothetical protein [Effusibacillus pohliae]|uniref:hypothetical protein n=1 Tax=Effusibacillus pohliae TaxID=232270 RepID=UPI0003628F29|nr:hypothetical protein [Effusibacillus pohliae]